VGWLSRAQAAEAEALASLYVSHGAAIRRYCERVLGNPAQADDATQETFLRAFQRLATLRDPQRVEGWLYSIAAHVCLDALRKRQRARLLRFWERDDSPAALEGELAEADLVRRALASLPPEQAVCLVLRVVEGFSCDEIAEMLGLSRAAVWQRLSRARARFAQAHARLARGERG